MAQNHRRWITLIFYGIGLVGMVSSAVTATDMDFGKRKAIEASAQVSASPPQIALVWPARTDIAAYEIRRLQPDGTITTFFAAGDSAGYVDTDVNPGVGITYLIKARSNAGFSTAYGHVLAGINVPAEESRGIIIVVVDENQAASLSSELERLHRDLVGDGWQVDRNDVAPSLPPPAIKSIIQNRYQSEPSRVRAVLLLGNIAVPYSGNRAPDGHHPDHEGAWPADTYYADMSGIWTDATINNTAASGTRNDNVPGDGKFDPSNVPGETKLAVGRVDLSDMPAFASSETELLRSYLDKNHAYRNAITEIEQRAIVDANLDEVINGSGAYTFSEGFASTARRSFSAMFGTANVFDSDWFPEVETNTYAWGYAGGYGGYSHLTGLATTSQLAAKNPRVIFTMLSGSYLGDWDTPDNFLRAPLCTGSTLASCWSGRPGWLFYRMALGQTLGDCTLETQNSSANFYIQQGSFARGVHVNLMGDPTLRLHMIKPPVQLSAIGDGERPTELTWVEPSGRDDISYRIYRSSSINDPFVRIDDEEETISATSFIDPSPVNGSIYMVRTLALTSSASGSYYNLSQGSFAAQIQPVVDPTIVWNAPVAINYGTALNNIQLNATANVQGTFSYTPPTGTVLDAGTHTLTTTFTPTDTSRYASASKSITITVNKATPTITWNTPAPITYGTALSITQLNASCDAPGMLSYTPTAGTVLGAGDVQQLQVALPESANYFTASTSVTIDVIPAPLVITADDKQRRAGFENPPLTASYSGFVNGDTAVSTPPALATTAERSSAPGSYPITMTGGSDANYSITFVDGTLTVAQREIPVITWSDPVAFTYGTALNNTQLDATANVQGTFSYTPPTDTVLNAGTHTLTTTFTPTDTSRYAGASKSVAITVNKATPTITWNTPAPITYGTDLRDTQLNASCDAPGILSYTPAAGTVLGAGSSQQLQVQLPESANYSAASTSVTIDVIPAALTIAADDKQRRAGFDNPPLTASYSGFVNGDTAVSTPPALATTAERSSAPGNYPITVTGGSDANYFITFVDGTLTLAEREIPVITWSDPVAITYGTALNNTQLNATANVQGTFSYTPPADTMLDAGTHTLTTTFTPTDTSRYASARKSVAITVNKAVPTITWNTPAPITYGTALGITQLNASCDAPGILSYTPAAGTVLNAGDVQQLQVQSPESANYSAASTSVTIDVIPAALTIAADDKQRRAGFDNPPLTATYSGFVNGDTAISTPPALATTAERTSAPGNYPITVTGGSDANYIITPVDGTLTVAEKEISVITWSDPVAITYGTALNNTQLDATANVQGTFSYAPPTDTVLDAGTHTLTTTFTPTDTSRYASASKSITTTVDKATPTITWNTPAPITYGTALGITQLNATSDTPGMLSYTPAAGTVLGTGTSQQLQVKSPESANYSAGNAVVTIDVIPAALTIAADDKQRRAGFDNPPLTANYSGFVNGDTAISTPPALATTAERSSAPGNYPITVTAGSDANYIITPVDGTLTVAEREIPVITWSDPVAITYGTVLNVSQLAAIANVQGTFSYAPPADTMLDAGTHTLTTTFTPTDTSRYASASKSVAITVNKATPTITWNNPAAITYGTALSDMQLNASSDAPGMLSYTPTAGTVLGAGSFQQLQVKSPESANYSAGNAVVTIDVIPATLTITADDKQRRAGFENPPLTASYSGFVNGDTAISTPPTLATTAERSSAPGNYPITVTGGSDANYTITFVDGTLTIAEREIPVINWSDPAAIPYGTALNVSQLDATANVQGTFSYIPPIDTVLDAGTHTLTTTFTPTDTSRYASASKSVAITVNKATPTITWSTPPPITYGTALSDTQLNASSDAPGTFVYAIPAGTVLNAKKDKLMLASLPESANFSVGNAVVTIDVIPAPLVIAADDKQRGAGFDNPPLTASYSGFVNGDTAVSTPPTLTTTAEKSSAPGDYPISMTGGSDPNYTITLVDGSLRVADKVVPVITWNTPAEITSGTPLGGEQLNATVSTIEGNFVYKPAFGEVLDVGTHALTAEFTPLDPARYATATASVAITVELPASEWQNPDNPLDVFADGLIDSRDVAVALILLHSPVTNDQTYPDAGICPDVDGDGKVTLLDVDAVASQLPEEMLEKLLPKDLPSFKLRPSVATVGLGSNGVNLSFSGEPGKTYDLQYSVLSNPPAWETLISDLSGEIHFEDDDSERQSRPGGYYRFVGRPGRGDFDQNGEFGDRDIDMLTTAIRSGENSLVFDLNEDGSVDMSDRRFLVEHQTKLNTSMGDLTLNGEVDFLDYFKFAREFGKQNSVWRTGDFDGDGSTGLSDLLLLSDNFEAKRPGDVAYIPRATLVTHWQNITWREDVNADGSVDAADVVAIINQLEKMKAFGTDPAPLPDSTEIKSSIPYVDTNGDGMLSPSDARNVQKFLNAVQE